MLGMKIGQSVVITITGFDNDLSGTVTTSPSPDVVSIQRRGESPLNIALAHIVCWSVQ